MKQKRADFKRFADAVADGSFYERLCRLSGLERDVVKLRFIVDVLAKKGRYPSKVEDVFREEFPSVHRFIRSVNRQNPAELIRLLQRAESWLVVENVAPRLMARGCRAVTLHDAMFTAQESLDDVEAAFAEVLDEIGLRLSLKREHSLLCAKQLPA